MNANGLQSAGDGWSRQVGSNFAMRLAGLGLQFAMLVTLTRLLSTEAFGGYAIAMAWVLLLGVQALMGADRLVLRELPRAIHDGEVGRAAGLWRWAVRLCLTASVVFAVLLFVAAAMGWTGYDPAVSRAMRIAAVGVPVVAITHLSRSRLEAMGRATLGLVGEMVCLPVVVVALLLALSGRGVMLSAATATAVVVIGWSAAMMWNVGSATVKTPAAVRGAQAVAGAGWSRLVWPLALLSGVELVNIYADVIMLGWLAGTELAGIYVPAARGASLIAVILISANAVIAPRVAVLHHRGERAALGRLYHRAAAVTCVGGLLLAGGFIVFATLFLGLFGEAYADATTALRILCVGQAVNLAVGSVGTVLLMCGYERDVLGALVFTAAVNIVLNLVLIPYYGINGAAVATAASLVIWNVVLAVRLRQRLGFFATPLGAWLPVRRDS